MTNRLKTFILGALILFYIFIMLTTTVVEGYEVLNPSMYNTQMNSSCDSENWPLGSLGVLTRVTNDRPPMNTPSTSNINVYIHSLESPTSTPSSTSAPEMTTPASTTIPTVTTPFVSTPAVFPPPSVTTPAVTTPAVTTPVVTPLAVNTPAITTPAVATPAINPFAVNPLAAATPAVTTRPIQPVIPVAAATPAVTTRPMQPNIPGITPAARL